MEKSETDPRCEIAMTAKSLAPFIGCAVPTIYKMAAASVIPYVPVGVRQRGRRFYLSAVRAALEERARGLRSRNSAV